MAPKFDSKPGIQSAQKKGVGAICCTLLCYFYLGKYSRQYETHKCRNFPLAWTDGTVTWYFFKMGYKTVALKGMTSTLSLKTPSEDCSKIPTSLMSLWLAATENR